MLKLKRVSEMYEMRVYTDGGEYFGDVEELVLTKTKVSMWRIKATKNSFLSNVLGGAKGVLVPHNLVKSIGDIVIISRSAIPNFGGEKEEAEA
ncbi:photosystem reaction center subunit H [Candidatus Woesearchaeota archaeon]|jgi:sporulation protein YlmC with PRC-barrel domain|nr:photosystem reaction center subunit H [Candidatus Woesearchaeota archaeon]MBT4368731.1 photosystem reaction center subunit H [Candidatus Woesearchaeota archaeon]MBT4712020.1 photosystem reaction center subunit H [Candidatus Woesearchaeota archaeon]MBT6638915.1 photosystem reaction center subunit H [Candidatus Woesearchaeota archaeon]MBT7134559.1 photosystem reaction center subunit H [Candidatus Woesearchaeota archaeon]